MTLPAQIGRRTEIPAGDSARVLDAITMLHQLADGQPPQLGRRVVVYGGGNTAMDAARAGLMGRSERRASRAVPTGSAADRGAQASATR